jgi:hypothetical protein
MRSHAPAAKARSTHAREKESCHHPHNCTSLKSTSPPRATLERDHWQASGSQAWLLSRPIDACQRESQCHQWPSPPLQCHRRSGALEATGQTRERARAHEVLLCREVQASGRCGVGGGQLLEVAVVRGTIQASGRCGVGSSWCAGEVQASGKARCESRRRRRRAAAAGHGGGRAAGRAHAGARRSRQRRRDRRRQAAAGARRAGCVRELLPSPRPTPTASCVADAEDDADA